MNDSDRLALKHENCGSPYALSPGVPARARNFPPKPYHRAYGGEDTVLDEI